MTTRNEAMADFDRAEEARAHRTYLTKLKWWRGICAASRPRGGPESLARDAVVRAIDKLIAQAEASE